MRLFVGIDVPEYIKQEVDRVQKILQETCSFEGVLIPLQQLHITLKFIGEVSEGQVPYIDNAIKSIQFNKTVASLDHLDLFIDDDVNVIYIEVDCPVLGILVDTLESVLESWCLYDNIPFVAHLTLFRVSHVYQKATLVDCLKQCKIQQLSFEVNEFLLKQSIQESNAVLYETVGRYPLY